jgi:hypothetical protein
VDAENSRGRVIEAVEFDSVGQQRYRKAHLASVLRGQLEVQKHRHTALDGRIVLVPGLEQGRERIRGSIGLTAEPHGILEYRSCRVLIEINVIGKGRQGTEYRQNGEQNSFHVTHFSQTGAL